MDTGRIETHLEGYAVTYFMKESQQASQFYWSLLQ
jgi:hypothetical protein